MSALPDRRSARAWAITAALCVVYLLLWLIPAPGIDHQALQAMAAAAGGASILTLGNLDLAPVVSLAGAGPGSLVLVRGVLALLPRRSRVPWAAIGFVVYLMLVGIAASMTVVYLESASSPIPVVTTPGWGFRLTLLLTFAAGGAVMWAIATAITRWGIAHGAVVLAGVTFAMHAFGRLASVGAYANAGAGAGWVGWALGAVLYALPPAIVGLALWRRSPVWPVRMVREAELLSGVDAVFLPWILAAIAAAPTGLVVTLLPPSELMFSVSEQLPHLETLLALVAAVALAVWLGQRGEKRGSVLALIGALLVPAAAVVVALLSFVVTGALGAALEPGPFAGEVDAELELEPVDPGARAAADAETIAARLRELGIAADVSAASTGRIRMRVEDVSSPADVVAAVSSRRRLEFRIVSANQGIVAPRPDAVPPTPALTIDSERYGDGAGELVWRAPSAAELEPVLAPLAPEVRASVAIECSDLARFDERPRQSCSPYLLEPVAVDGSAIESAEVQMDPMDNRPYVMLVFDDEGARRFGAVTAANVRRKLAIVIDGRIESAPVIMSAIHGGRAQITLGSARSFPELMTEARALAASLQSGELSSDWRAASVRQL